MRFKIHILVALLAFISAVPSARAQDDDNVLIYSSEGASRQGNKATTAAKALIKINPLLIMNGDIPIYLETKIGKKISAEVGLGATHWDLMFENFDRVNRDANTETSEERRAQIGYSARLNFKYYPSDYYPPLEDWYGGLEFRYRHYNTEISDCSSTGTSGFIPETRSQVDGRIIFGYIYYLSDNIIVDLYGGIGIRVRDLDRKACVSDGVFTTVREDTFNGTDSRPIVSAGIKLGFTL